VSIAGHCADKYYRTGGCYVGLTPLSKKADAWEPFNATFAPAEPVVTVYINQHGPDSTNLTYSSVVYGLTVQQQLIGTLVLFVKLSFCLPRPLPSLRPIRSLVSCVPSMYRVHPVLPRALLPLAAYIVYHASRAPSR
jgi:hypothetical protein